MATTAAGTPYVESSDLVANYPGVSLALANHIDDTGGKVLQVIRATDSTERSTTSATFVDASLSVTITPQSTTNQVLLMCNFFARTTGYSRWQITDSSNNPISGAETSLIGTNGSIGMYVPFTLVAFASPATITAVTFKLRFRAQTGTTVMENDEATAQLYAIEVAA